MANPIQFIKEVKSELFKVVWPSRKEAIRITVAVIVFSVFMALFLGAVDFGLNKAFDQLINR